MIKKLLLLSILILPTITLGLGGQIMDSNDPNTPYTLVSPYDANDVFELQYAQSADEMYIVHNNYAPRVLSRYSDTDWTLALLDFQNGPFLTENSDKDITISSSTTGLSDYYDSYITGDNSQGIMRSTSWMCQTFTASASYDVNSIRLKLWRVGSPGNMIVSIRATSGGSPTGADAAVGYTSANAFTTLSEGAWYTIDMNSPYSITSGTTYAIVARATLGSTYNTVYWREDTSLPTYSGGSMGASSNSGSTWSMYTSSDLMFSVIDSNNIVASGGTTLEASGDIWDGNHVGALWQISHVVEANSVRVAFAQWDNGVTHCYDYDGGYSWESAPASPNSVAIYVQKNRYFDFTSSGTWSGNLFLQRSYDNKTTWEDVVGTSSDNSNNIQYSGQETYDNAYYRMYFESMPGQTSPCGATLMLRSFTNNGIVRITEYVDANTVYAEIIEPLAYTSATYRWAEGAWSPYQGYPSCITFYEGRLCLAATSRDTQTIWFSQSDDWDNFEEGGDATDAFHITIASDQVNVIRWMSPQSVLIVGTSGAEWKICAAKQTTAFTPTNYTCTRQSTYGSEFHQAISTDSQTLYIQRQDRKVRQIKYSFEQDIWVSPDMTLLAEHITESGIKDWAYQKNPYPILWCVKENGDIATLTLEENEDVIGWSLQTTEGDYESVAVIPDANEDRVWFVVNRANGRYVEQLQPFDWGTRQEDCFFVDSGLTFDGGAAKTISGATQAFPCVLTVVGHGFTDGQQVRITDVNGMTELNDEVWTVGTVVDVNSFQLRIKEDSNDVNSVDFTAYGSDGSIEVVENTFVTLSHLEDQSVIVLGDGGYAGTYTVDANTITLTDYYNKVHAGLPYTAKLRPMKLEDSSSPGALFGTTMRITNITVRLNQTLGCDIGKSWTSYDSVLFRDASDLLETATPLFTGDKRASFQGGYTRSGEIYIQNRLPLPITVLALKAEYETGSN